ncbi:MAG: tRNA lysidine(34) synthetase TilS [Oscillospiraceae bacterium]|nr:tRNA lysidine(34) synthetase TilS [Oscillospiraceae bacterium]
MLDFVKTAITQHNMITAGDDIVVALSGGADSVALLKAMLLLREEYDITVSACHINHNLRGEASDNDEQFVRELCKRMNVPLTVHSIDVRSLQQKHESIEETARNARYDVFNKLSTVATAHSASDNAETVLLNLIRGTALKGLCGIPPVRDNIIRPLILCTRSQIEEFCIEYNLEYVTDETNNSLEFTRNKIRHNLIPLINEMNPSFVTSISKMTEILRIDDELIDNMANSGDYSISYLVNLEKPILTRIISRLLSHNNISPSFTRISQITGIVTAGQGKVNISKNKFALIEDEKLKIVTIFQNYRNNI